MKNKIELFFIKLFISAFGQKCPKCGVRAERKHRPECSLRRFNEVWE